MSPRHARARCCVVLLVGLVAAGCKDATDPPEPPGEAPAPVLAFTMDSSIYVISTAEGATPSLLLSGFIKPSWSPDGRTLAMVRTGPPLAEALPPTEALYLADADGSNPRALTEFGLLIREPILWSPDGTVLLFVRARTYMPSSSHVARVPAAGGVEDAPFGDFEDFVRFNGLPSWSGDGSRVALDHGGTINLANADGSGRTRLTSGSTPRWSPMSDHIAYHELVSTRVHLIRSDGSDNRDLGAEGWPEAWSPDGTRLAFLKSSVGLLETWVVNADGSEPARVGPEGAGVSGIAWSADSKRIAYILRSSPTDPIEAPAAIYVARSDGSEARALVSSRVVCCLSWRP